MDDPEEGRSILVARIQALIRELDRAEKAVEQIDPELRQRVQGRFFDLFGKQREALKRLREDVNNQQPLRACWSLFRDIRQRDCEPLFQECLALMQGSLVRTSRLDDDLCQIADALLYDLSRRTDILWGRFTILATQEFIFIADMPEIVRVRFPEVSIWSLPIAAHEFGHFVGARLEKERIGGGHVHPFQEFLEKVCGQDAKCAAFLHEYFADLLATYALGPAYACSCILLRFDPWDGYLDKRVHPSESKRVYWILSVLKKMDEAEAVRQRAYRGVIKHLKQVWEQSLESVGQPGTFEKRLGEETTQQLDAWLDELYFLAEDKLSAIWYRAEDWLRARTELSNPLLDNKPLALQDEYTLADVLNAAWWCRIQPGGEESARVQRVGERAVECCFKIGGILYG